jgi:hypothetical protein
MDEEFNEYNAVVCIVLAVNMLYPQLNADFPVDENRVRNWQTQKVQQYLPHGQLRWEWLEWPGLVVTD